MAHYTTVAEMTDKVNRLADLVSQAQALAKELKQENSMNYYLLRTFPNGAQEEERPLTMPERITEASRYETLFGGIERKLGFIIEDIQTRY